MPVSDAFAEAMVHMAEAYGVEVSAERIQVYAALLADLPEAEVLAAMREAALVCRFLPTVADIREQAQGRPEDALVRQWAGLLAAAGSVGGYEDLYVEDPAAAEALVAVFGSWAAFCEQAVEGPALAARKQEFGAAYRQAKRARQGRTYKGPTRLQGALSGGDRYVAAWAGRLCLTGAVEAGPVARMQRPLPASGPRPALAPGRE